MDEDERGPPERPGITLLYVRPDRGELTELDRRIGAIAARYAQVVTLRVVSPEDLAESAAGLVRAAGWGSPALFLLRDGEVVGEAMGALLPERELNEVVRRAVEWPAPPAPPAPLAP